MSGRTIFHILLLLSLSASAAAAPVRETAPPPDARKLDLEKIRKYCLDPHATFPIDPPRELTDKDRLLTGFQTRCAHSASVPQCLDTYEKLIPRSEEIKKLITAAKDEVCDGDKPRLADCGSGQKDCLESQAGQLEKIRAAFGGIAEKSRKLATELRLRQGELLLAASRSLRSELARDPAKLKTGELLLRRVRTEHIPAVDQRNELLRGCRTRIGSGSSACELTAAAAEARHFERQLSDISGISRPMSERAGEIAGTLRNRSENLGNPDGKKKGLFGGMGLDDMVKLATLGMMGAGMYCSMSGKCSQQPENSSISDPNAGLATSPTPANNSAEKSGPEKSALGDPAKSGAATPAPGGSPATDHSPSGPGGNFSGGFSGGSGEDPLGAFNNKLEADRSPASPAATAPGAGSGPGTGGSSDGLPVAKDPENPAGKETEYALAGGGGLHGGPGGSGNASGGFSLDSPASSSTDNALKNILNGDAPGDASLAGLGDPGPGGPGMETGSLLGMEAPDSLFARIKDTHQRCVKRGCVGQGAYSGTHGGGEPI